MWQWWWQKRGLIFSWALGLGLLSLTISFLFPKWYGATAEVLLISRDRGGYDPYTQAKSSERLGQNLAQALSTTDFLNKVLEPTTVEFNRERWLALTPRQQRRRWPRDVSASVVYNSSILRLNVVAPSSAEAAALSRAVIATLIARGAEYLGADVILKEVNPPLVSILPARPNLALNFVVGCLVGALLAALWTARYHKKRLFGND